MGRILHFILGCTVAGFCGVFAVPSQAQVQGQAESKIRRMVVEDVPALKPIRHVSAEKTHSRFPVPRYVSLKFGRVNGRQGPSVNHSALWQYQRKGMPLIVVAEMDIWRKVRDMHGDESWVRTQALSGQWNGVVLNETKLYYRPRETATVKAIANKGALLNIVECNSDNWCQVRSEEGHKGWVLRDTLWGAAPLSK